HPGNCRGEDLPHDSVRWRYLLELYLQPGADPAREDHALHGAVCHEGHATLPRLYARPGEISAQGKCPRSQRVLRVGGRDADDVCVIYTSIHNSIDARGNHSGRLRTPVACHDPQSVTGSGPRPFTRRIADVTGFPTTWYDSAAGSRGYW